MIKVVIFDLGGIFIDNSWVEIYQLISKETGLSESFVKETSNPLLKKWERGEIEEKDFWEGFERRTKITLTGKFKKGLWVETHKRYTKELPEAWRILERLKKEKKRIVLLSNIIPPHLESIRKRGIEKKLANRGVEAFLYSCEIGLSKPGIDIYKVVLDRLETSPEKCIFIDDRVKNIEGAKKAGIEGILFENSSKLEEELFRIKS
jgi:epoxide hydrolase-like predicted phosphatase